MYTQQQLSLNAMARQMNQRLIPTHSGKVGWRRQTIWHMLRNPAYRGTACYGKTGLQPRPQGTRFCDSEIVRRIQTRSTVSVHGMSGSR
jgi:site-specific DNA recombinase